MQIADRARAAVQNQSNSTIANSCISALPERCGQILKPRARCSQHQPARLRYSRRQSGFVRITYRLEQDCSKRNANVTISNGFRTFTPVPKRIQDGTEDILSAAVVSGAPMELQARTVRIYMEVKPATQSGHFRGHHWRMDWDILSKGHRWENPLMGWQSSGDFMQGTHLNFKTKEDAIFFAEKQGYEYFVQEPNSRKFTPKAYANNFLYSPKKLKTIRTK
ncbi:hypothetical protein CDD82_7120 [Ophiocordyceps australis]|uniref:NADH dehydrogenase [ubiquinone] iron-sulfur protein 4, mitochondrial n=1 Tax=Ophiocordyceps australis TaxID=1399860 RepID=A0A2C5Y6Q5_9HYPO|nr:hypothetical protein CDD82_7120 [Ophiocordyceps australis]